jgi:replicative DNA helicase
MRSKDLSLQKLPPQSIEAEESILSAILLDNNTLLDVLELLAPENFYRTAHQIIFSAINDLFRKAQPVDLVTLTNLLREKNKLEEIGGAAYLARLVDTVPSAINVQHYARIVRDKSSLRQLIAKSNEITQRCYEDGGDLDHSTRLRRKRRFPNI